MENSTQTRKISTEMTASPLDSMEHPFFAQKHFLISVLAELFALPVLFVARRWLVTNGFSEEPEYFFIAYSVSIGVLFAVGFRIGYSAVKLSRIYLSKSAPDLRIESGVMSGYAQSEEQSKNRLAWLIGTAAGVLNLIGFVLLIDVTNKLL